MNRREAIAGGIAGLGAAALRAEPGGAVRDWYLLRRYAADTAQRTGLEAFYRDVAIPQAAAAGGGPVGLFVPREGEGDVWSLSCWPTVEAALAATDRLLAAAPEHPFVTGPKDAAPYATSDAWLLRAFEGMPRLARPATGEGRVMQLRIYESPSAGTGRTKIAMFNKEELAVFQKVGLTPVCFGETIIGPGMPSLVYLLAFESPQAQDAAWRAFGGDPDWQRLRAMPEYADSRIIRRITNVPLKPAACSQI